MPGFGGAPARQPQPTRVSCCSRSDRLGAVWLGGEALGMPGFGGAPARRPQPTRVSVGVATYGASEPVHAGVQCRPAQQAAFVLTQTCSCSAARSPCNIGPPTCPLISPAGLTFLYLITGNLERLGKMAKIADMRCVRLCCCHGDCVHWPLVCVSTAPCRPCGLGSWGSTAAG